MALHESSINDYLRSSLTIARHHFEEWAQSQHPIDLYSSLKHLFNEILIRQFFGIAEDDLGSKQRISALIQTHFRGANAVPVKVNVLGINNTYTRSQNAFEELCQTAAAFLLEMMQCPTPTDCTDPKTFIERVGDKLVSIHASSALVDEAARHLVLFSSSIVNKCLASLSTSLLCAWFSNKDIYEGVAAEVFAALRDDADLFTSATHLSQLRILRQSLLEVQRLHPPLIGVCRGIVNVTDNAKPVMIGEHRIDPKYKLWMCMALANRDKDVFGDDAEQMRCSRWDEVPERNLAFGHGPRHCVGHVLVLPLVSSICADIMFGGQYRLEPEDLQCSNMKRLPVQRPKEPFSVDVHKL